MTGEPSAASLLRLSPEFRHLWALFAAVALFNAAVCWWRLQEPIARRLDLASGYRRFAAGLAVVLTLPWLVMGLGIELGGVPDMFSYLRLRGGNPFVLAFYAVITVEILSGCYWVFFCRGAEFLVRHPGILRTPAVGTRGIRAFAVFILAVWIIMTTLRWLDLLPVPPLR